MEDFLESLDLLGLALNGVGRLVRAVRRGWKFATNAAVGRARREGRPPAS
jgi:hypothetical protein